MKRCQWREMGRVLVSRARHCAEDLGIWAYTVPHKSWLHLAIDLLLAELLQGLDVVFLWATNSLPPQPSINVCRELFLPTGQSPGIFRGPREEIVHLVLDEWRQG